MGFRRKATMAGLVGGGIAWFARSRGKQASSGSARMAGGRSSTATADSGAPREVAATADAKPWESKLVEGDGTPEPGIDVASNEDLVRAERDALTVDDDDGHRRRDQTQGKAAQEIAREQVRQRLNGAGVGGSADTQAEAEDVVDLRQTAPR